MQISNIESKTDTQSREYIRFSLTVNPLSTPWSWQVSGWRWFPETNKLTPPAYRGGRAWVPLVEGVTDDQKKAIVSALKRAMAGDGDLISALDIAGDDITAHNDLMIAHGAEYVSSFYHWSKERTESPEAFEALWESVPNDRLWPDILLLARAEDLMEGLVSPEEQKQCVESGAFTVADQQRIVEFLRGKQ